MESNELNKNAASEETELLQNDEVVLAEVAPESTDLKKEESIEEIDPSPVQLSDSLTDPVLTQVWAGEVSEEPEAKEEVYISELAEVPITEIKPDSIEIVALESEVVEPLINLDKIPNPVVEVACAAETTLIEQIVQIPDESEDDDDLFSDRESDAHAIPIHDYSSYSKVQLVNTLRKILSEGTAEEIRPHAEAIKGCFYKIRNSEIQEQKLAFTAEGNEEELFEPKEDLQEAELKDLLREYKNLRAELNKKQEAVKEENYHKKLAIIEEIKSLINSEE